MAERCRVFTAWRVGGLACLAGLLAAAALAAGPVALEGVGDGRPVPAPAPAASPAAGGSANAVVLYDNGPLINCPGCGSGGADESQLQLVLGMSSYGMAVRHASMGGYRLADDFLIGHAEGWTLDTITFFAYQTGSTTASTLTGVYLQIWDGPPDSPASCVIWGDQTTNRLRSTGWWQSYRVRDDMSGATDRPVMEVVADVRRWLPPGTYWLDWSMDGSLASGPWAPPVTITGQTVTGNALLYYLTGWIDAADGGTATQQGFPFVVQGCLGRRTVSTAPLLLLLAPP